MKVKISAFSVACLLSINWTVSPNSLVLKHLYVILKLFFCLFSTETQNNVAMLMKQFAQQHSADFQAAVISLPGEQLAKLSVAISAS